MKLTNAMQSFVLHWGEMGTKWGLNRSVAQIFALLHIAPDPLNAEDIAATLNLARSNVSTALKELQAWRLIRITRQLGDRRDHYATIADIYDLAQAIAEARRQREILPTIDALRQVQADAETDATPPVVRDRIAQTLDVMQELDDMYGHLTALPRGSQITMLRAGAKLGAMYNAIAGTKDQTPQTSGATDTLSGTGPKTDQAPAPQAEPDGAQSGKTKPKKAKSKKAKKTG